MIQTPHRQVLREALRVAALAYEQVSLRSLRLRASVLWHCWRHRRRLSRWYSPDGDPALREALAQRPTLAAIVHWPYLNRQWSVGERMRALEQHYAMLTDQLAFMRFPFDRHIVLAAVDSACGRLRIVLDKPSWFMREGDVVINLFLDQERMYSLAFTLGERQGVRVAYVGAVQGRSMPHVVDVYRAMTRAAHGMRPRDLLFACFRLLCGELRVQRIYGVSDAACPQRSDYFGANADKVHAEYDAMWAGYGGVPDRDGFFRIDPRLPRKRSEDIVSKKRALYRRRYLMLDELSAQLSARCGGATTTCRMPVAEAA
jgi:uncharacterized protein VirK/YbjX